MFLSTPTHKHLLQATEHKTEQQAFNNESQNNAPVLIQVAGFVMWAVIAADKVQLT